MFNVLVSSHRNFRGAAVGSLVTPTHQRLFRRFCRQRFLVRQRFLTRLRIDYLLEARGGCGTIGGCLSRRCAAQAGRFLMLLYQLPEPSYWNNKILSRDIKKRPRDLQMLINF